MIAPRALDPSTEHGFAKTRNADLTRMFESGGQYGGKRGEALTTERERIAFVMNRFLETAGSVRRADHRSNAARGLHDREPEPKVGEDRKAACRKRGKGDRRTQLVSSMRSARIADNQLRQTEEELMATNATRQAKGGIRPRTKLDFKSKLLKDSFPDLPNVEGWAASLHFIDTNTPGLTRIATRNGGHVEIRGRMAKVYGARGQADALAAALEAADDLDDIERLEELKSIQRKGSGLRQRRKPDEVPSLPADKVESLADRWRSRGYHRVTESKDGCWIEIGRCRIQDLGDELRIHGPSASDSAVRAMVEKAAAEWGSEVEVFGDRAFRDQAWLEAQRQGVTVYDQATGELYQPSEEVRRRFDADRSRMKSEGDEIDEIKRRKAIAALLLEAAAGDTEALTRLRTSDQQLADFVVLHLDDEQRGKLVGKPEADVVAALPDFRDFGQAARDLEDEKRRGEAAEGLTPDGDRPEDEAELEAWRKARYEARVRAEDEAKWAPR